MANYTKITNFTAKDSLTSGDPNKVVKGAEIDTEFTAISTAIATATLPWISLEKLRKIRIRTPNLFMLHTRWVAIIMIFLQMVESISIWEPAK